MFGGGSSPKGAWIKTWNNHCIAAEIVIDWLPSGVLNYFDDDDDDDES